MEKKGFVFFVSGKLTGKGGHSLRQFVYEGKVISSVVGSAPVIARLKGVQPVAFVPHSLDDEDVEVIKEELPSTQIVKSPAMGVFNGKTFTSNYSSLTFFFLFHMLKTTEIWKENGLNLFADISTGNNQITFSMAEAFRYLEVFSHLSRIGLGESNQFQIAYSEPAIGNLKEALKVFSEPFKVKGFPSLPLSYRGVKEAERELQKLPIKKEVANEIISLSQRAVLILTAVLKNIPLAVYLLGYNTPSEIEKTLNLLIKELEPVMGNDKNPPDFRKEDGKVLYSFSPEGLNFRRIISLILLIGFYYGISELLRKYHVPNTPNSCENVDKLLSKFRGIYSSLFGTENVNYTLLEKDISRLRTIISNFKKDNRIILDYFLPGEKVDTEEKHKNSKPQLRNFFAHSGLLTNMMEFNLKDETVRCKKEKNKTVENFLIKLSNEFTQ